MDWLTFFSNTIGHIAWPVLIGFGIYQLKDPIKEVTPKLLENLASRLKKAGALEFEDPKQEEVKKEEIPLNPALKIPDPYGLIDKVKTNITNALEIESLSDEGKLEAVVEAHASLQLRNLWSNILYQIYGSQLKLLDEMAATGTPMPAASFVSAYSGMIHNHPEVFAGARYDNYINWLVTVGLIEKAEAKDTYQLTDFGRGFLDFKKEPQNINVVNRY